MIPDSKIEEIRERVDIIALVQRHGVELKKSGRSYKGLCPFHQEKSPSFYVFPEGKRFKCFGCQAGGDAISFEQRLLGKTFLDTVRDLAKEIGVDLEASVDPAMREKAQLKEATDFAATRFQAHLWDTAIGHHAREYLRSRGLTEDVMKAFGLGWSPMLWTDLADKLRESGLLAFGEKAGLVSPRQKGDGYYDMFRGRLMIPIRSPEGRTIAFGGRLLEGDDGPKYLNSKDSRLYNKSDTLYGTDLARDEIRKKKSVVLCEGYFDCIGLHQAGVKNAVALCSTALTPGHLALLHRLEAKELVLLLDGDDAGRKAVERLAGPILAGGVTSRVAVLPDGEDPDTWARKVGPEAVQKLVASAPTLTEHLFRTVLSEGPAASFEGKMAALDRLRPIAAMLPVGLMRSAFFGALSRHSGLPASELEIEMRGKGTQAVRAAPKPASNVPKEPPPDQLEAMLAAMVLRSRALLRKDVYRVADELKHMGIRTLIARLQSGQAPVDCLYEASDVLKDSLQKARDQFMQMDDASLDLAFDTVSTKLKLRFVDEHINRVNAELAKVHGANELTAEARLLLEEKNQLLSLKNELKKKKTI